MLELFLPRRCIHCNEPARKTEDPLSKYLCPNCLRELAFLEPPTNEEIEDRRRLLGHLPYPIGIYAAYTFIPEGVLQSVIHHFKYMDMPRLARYFGDSVSKEFSELRQFVDIVIPVPLHVTRYAERGYNQSEILAKSLARAFKKEMSAEVIKRVKPTPSQTGLSIAEREENVRDAFTLTKKGPAIITGKRVLVIDDVITTGATMASIGAALSEAHPKEVGFFTLAAAQLGA